MAGQKDNGAAGEFDFKDPEMADLMDNGAAGAFNFVHRGMTEVGMSEEACKEFLNMACAVSEPGKLKSVQLWKHATQPFHALKPATKLGKRPNPTIRTADSKKPALKIEEPKKLDLELRLGCGSAFGTTQTQEYTLLLQTGGKSQGESLSSFETVTSPALVLAMGGPSRSELGFVGANPILQDGLVLAPAPAEVMVPLFDLNEPPPAELMQVAAGGETGSHAEI